MPDRGLHVGAVVVGLSEGKCQSLFIKNKKAVAVSDCSVGDCSIVEHLRRTAVNPSARRYESNAGLVVAVKETEASVERKRLFDCPYFFVWTLKGREEFTVGAEKMPHVLVCTAGAGQIEHGDISYPVERGDVWLLPAVVAESIFRPIGLVALLEFAIPSQTYREREQLVLSA